MNDNVNKTILDYLSSIDSARVSENGADLSETEKARAQGYLEGMKFVSMQIRAIIDTPAPKPLVKGCHVDITGGPWKGNKGTFEGLAATAVGTIGLVLIEGFDLPMDVEVEYIRAV